MIELDVNLTSKVSKKVKIMTDAEREELVWKLVQERVSMRQILKEAHCGPVFVRDVKIKRDPEYAKKQMAKQMDF